MVFNVLIFERRIMHPSVVVSGMISHLMSLRSNNSHLSTHPIGICCGCKPQPAKTVQIAYTKAMKAKPYLTVVIPAYNEEERLAPTLAEIALYFSVKDFITEIIVVDDGSRDRTSRMVMQTFGNREMKKYSNVLPYLKRHSANLGKGAALSTGIMAASGRFMLLTDANGSTPVTEFDKLHIRSDLYDFIIGNRSVHTREYKPQYFLKKLMNAFTFAVGKTLFRISTSDILSDFRLIEARLAKEVAQEQLILRFGFDVESLVRARNKGVLIKEVPVMWHGKKDGKIRPVRESMETIADLVRLWQKIKE